MAPNKFLEILWMLIRSNKIYAGSVFGHRCNKMSNNIALYPTTAIPSSCPRNQSLHGMNLCHENWHVIVCERTTMLWILN